MGSERKVSRSRVYQGIIAGFVIEALMLIARGDLIVYLVGPFLMVVGKFTAAGRVYDIDPFASGVTMMVAETFAIVISHLL